MEMGHTNFWGCARGTRGFSVVRVPFSEFEREGGEVKYQYKLVDGWRVGWWDWGRYL
jgi:hypothetical protein